MFSATAWPASRMRCSTWRGWRWDGESKSSTASDMWVGPNCGHSGRESTATITSDRCCESVPITSFSASTARRPEDFEKLEPWTRLWERSTAAEFLRAYREIVSGAALLPSGEEDLRGL